MAILKLSSKLKLEIANILREFGKQAAIEIGCTLIEEKTGVERRVCKRAAIALVKRLQRE